MNIQKLMKKLISYADKADMSPQDYLNTCDALIGDFQKNIPHILDEIDKKSTFIQKENTKLTQKMKLGARRTHGSLQLPI